MIYTIGSQPAYLAYGNLQSANNTSDFTVLSTDDAQTDYQYKCDLYVNGSSTPTVTLSSFPNVPSGGYGEFEISNIVKNLVSYDFAGLYSEESNIGVHAAPNSSVSVQLFFGEQYWSGNTFVQVSNATASTIFNYSNASLSFVKSVATPNLNN